MASVDFLRATHTLTRKLTHANSHTHDNVCCVDGSVPYLRRPEAAAMPVRCMSTCQDRMTNTTLRDDPRETTAHTSTANTRITHGTGNTQTERRRAHIYPLRRIAGGHWGTVGSCDGQVTWPGTTAGVAMPRPTHSALPVCDDTQRQDSANIKLKRQRWRDTVHPPAARV